jgi:hypothetical protein
VNPRIRIVAASAFLAACGVSAANAAVEIDTEFAFNGAAIKPNDADISKATSIVFGAIIVEAVLADNTDLALDTLLTLTNPIPVGVGDMLTLSWKTVEGTFSATLTEKDLSRLQISLRPLRRPALSSVRTVFHQAPFRRASSSIRTDPIIQCTADCIHSRQSHRFQNRRPGQ